MEKDTGQKECPRCGLKNRLGANQCDFCGSDFRASSDEWLEMVGSLERISRSPVRSEIDQSTAARIELTIINPADIHVKAPLPAEDVILESADALDIVPDNSADVEMAEAVEVSGSGEEMLPAEETAVPETIDETPSIEIGATAAEESLSEAEPVTVPNEDAPAVAPVPDGPSEISLDRVAATTVNRSPEGKAATIGLDLVTVSLLVAGIAVYMGAILISPATGKAVGWVLAIIGAALITLAAGRLLASKKSSGDDELILCSNCHEVVSDADHDCPSCGARFTRPILKE